ncbi:MAG TPA: tetratricopeptide repeat protein [bacterium]|nr:tetratricopeptide repeat protein [bacterium]
MKRFQTLLLLLLLALQPGMALAKGKVSQVEKDYMKGLEFYLAGHYEKALTRFHWAIDGKWDFWQSYQMLGYCHFELREKEAALRAFQESLRLNPQNPALVKIVQDLKSGALDIPVRPVLAEEHPRGPVAEIPTYYSFNK